VRWVCGDIGRLDALPLLEECFDLIYSCGAIHYVPRAVRAKLVSRLKAITREYGLHAHIVFTDRAVYVEKGERIDYFAPGELTAFYSDWAILTREQRVTDCDRDGTIHRHSMEHSSLACRTGPPRRRNECGAGLRSSPSLAQSRAWPSRSAA